MWKPLFAVFKKETLIDKAFRNSHKMLDITEKMFLESKRSLHHIDQTETSINVYEKDIKVNKLERKVRKKVQKDLQEQGRGDIYPGLLLVSVIIDIERLGDYAKNILDLAKKYPGRLKYGSYKEDMEKIEAAVVDSFSRIRKQFIEMDSKKAELILDEYRWINKLCDKRAIDLIKEVDKSVSTRNAVAIVLYIRYLKRINSHLRNIATSIVNPFDKIGFSPSPKNR